MSYEIPFDCYREIISYLTYEDVVISGEDDLPTLAIYLKNTHKTYNFLEYVFQMCERKQNFVLPMNILDVLKDFIPIKWFARYVHLFHGYTKRYILNPKNTIYYHSCDISIFKNKTFAKKFFNNEMDYYSYAHIKKFNKNYLKCIQINNKLSETIMWKYRDVISSFDSSANYDISEEFFFKMEGRISWYKVKKITWKMILSDKNPDPEEFSYILGDIPLTEEIVKEILTFIDPVEDIGSHIKQGLMANKTLPIEYQKQFVRDIDTTDNLEFSIFRGFYPHAEFLKYIIDEKIPFDWNFFFEQNMHITTQICKEYGHLVKEICSAATEEAIDYFVSKQMIDTSTFDFFMSIVDKPRLLMKYFDRVKGCFEKHHKDYLTPNQLKILNI